MYTVKINDVMYNNDANKMYKNVLSDSRVVLVIVLSNCSSVVELCTCTLVSYIIIIVMRSRTCMHLLPELSS